jgi:hypothetical protein
MAISFDYKHQLQDGQSLDLIPLESRPAGTYYAKLDLSGNSVLSTVLVEAADAGASVLVEYFDFTTGFEIGEGNLLRAHNPLSSGLATDKVLVGNTHDKAYAKATVTGGSATFSVYGTVVSTSATELADAIIEENQTVNFLTDKAVAMGGYDETNGVWKFLRIGEDGEILVSSVTIFENVIHADATIAKGSEQTLIDKTYVSDTRVIKILCEGDGYGKFTVLINDSPWAIKRSSWNDRNVEIDMGAYKFGASDNIKVKVLNTNYGTSDADYNIFVYEG